MVVSLLEDSVPTKVLASLSRNNVPLSNNEDDVYPLQSLDILLKVTLFLIHLNAGALIRSLSTFGTFWNDS